MADLTSRGYKKLTARAYLKHVQPAVLRAGNVGSGLYQSSIDMSHGSCTVNVAMVASATVTGLQVTQELQTAIDGQMQSADYQAKRIPGARGQTKTVWLKNGFAVAVHAVVSRQSGASSQAILKTASASELSQAMAQ
ncbi:hypothetical protein J7443_13680 [Tropicibacter sp. R15_0]|uniref:hypothetical protein n=1 Tax=Tropicibacter sp. R15_0 TaxID=2821101 RepID=UPI001ADB3381|nr:hypothetical protein [Tropicibacter sp. R15_0]MBO9466289.1 hypothetical protein [Tropicibacter sp. R15_0]